MKLTKRIPAFMLCLLFICSMLVLSACGSNEGGTDNADTLSYEVTVVDGLGTPYTQKVIVKFMQEGSQVAMATINDQGVATKELPKGDYTVEIATTESGVSCWFDETQAVLSADKPQTQVTMAYAAGGEATTLTATSLATNASKEYEAYTVGAGSTYVSLTADDRAYVLFVPSESGIYEFSVTDNRAVVGYYGAPHFVQAQNLQETVDNTFTFAITEGNISQEQTGTTRLVIGLDAQDGAEGAVLNIQRIDDVPWSIEDEPWNAYQAKREITPYTLPEGVTLRPFDITAPTFVYKLVFNETDRCYHMGSADGSPVFVQLDKEVYGISMKNMVGEIIYEDGVLMQSGSAPFRYMYSNGQDDFFKEDYTDVMRQYVTNRDQAQGVYPLTEDLYYMLSKGIEFVGWCNPESGNYRFADVPGVNQELAAMFLFMYPDGGNIVLDPPVVPDTPVLPGVSDVTPDNGGNTDNTDNTDNNGTTETPDITDNNGTTVKPIEDNKSEPIEVGGTLEFDASVQPNHLVYYALYRVTDTTLTIFDPDAYVVYKNKTYKAVGGVVTVPNLYSSSTNVPVKLAIGNLGNSNKTFHATLSYPAGHQMNPYQLNMGSNSTYSAKDNNQGVYYTYTASKAGTLTIRLDSVSGNNGANISFTSANTDGGTRYANLTENANADGKSVSFKLAAGETVSIVIGVNPVEGFTYPEATINTTATFN